MAGGPAGTVLRRCAMTPGISCGSHADEAFYLSMSIKRCATLFCGHAAVIRSLWRYGEGDRAPPSGRRPGTTHARLTSVGSWLRGNTIHGAVLVYKNMLDILYRLQTRSPWTSFPTTGALIFRRRSIFVRTTFVRWRRGLVLTQPHSVQATVSYSREQSLRDREREAQDLQVRANISAPGTA